MRESGSEAKCLTESKVKKKPQWLSKSQEKKVSSCKMKDASKGAQGARTSSSQESNVQGKGRGKKPIKRKSETTVLHDIKRKRNASSVKESRETLTQQYNRIIAMAKNVAQSGNEQPLMSSPKPDMNGSTDQPMTQSSIRVVPSPICDVPDEPTCGSLLRKMVVDTDDIYPSPPNLTCFRSSGNHSGKMDDQVDDTIPSPKHMSFSSSPLTSEGEAGSLHNLTQAMLKSPECIDCNSSPFYDALDTSSPDPLLDLDDLIDEIFDASEGSETNNKPDSSAANGAVKLIKCKDDNQQTKEKRLLSISNDSSQSKNGGKQRELTEEGAGKNDTDVRNSQEKNTDFGTCEERQVEDSLPSSPRQADSADFRTDDKIEGSKILSTCKVLCEKLKTEPPDPGQAACEELLAICSQICREQSQTNLQENGGQSCKEECSCSDRENLVPVNASFIHDMESIEVPDPPPVCQTNEQSSFELYSKGCNSIPATGISTEGVEINGEPIFTSTQVKTDTRKSCPATVPGTKENCIVCSMQPVELTKREEQASSSSAAEPTNYLPQIIQKNERSGVDVLEDFADLDLSNSHLLDLDAKCENVEAQPGNVSSGQVTAATLFTGPFYHTTRSSQQQPPGNPEVILPRPPRLDWIRRVTESRERLRSVTQEINCLNAMLMRARRSIWPQQQVLPTGTSSSTCPPQPNPVPQQQPQQNQNLNSFTQPSEWSFT